jgi:hypothetical protein
MTRSRDREAVRISAWLVAAAVVAAAGGWMVLDATTAETAATPRPDARITASPGVAGGLQADVRDFAQATLFATRTPDGGVSVECADPETAAAMVFGAQR